MRVFRPLPADHPMVLDKTCCDLCKVTFQAGDRITLIPKDPVADDGKAHTVEAVPMHAVCVQLASRSRPYTIELGPSVNGTKDEHAGQWIVSFDPGAPGSRGHLKTTKNELDARRFPNHRAAWEFWMQDNGVRPDGKPNRPLTAWTVIIEPIAENLDVGTVNVDGVRPPEGLS